MPSAPYITLIGGAELAHEQATAYVDAGRLPMTMPMDRLRCSVVVQLIRDRAGVYVLTIPRLIVRGMRQTGDTNRHGIGYHSSR